MKLSKENRKCIINHESTSCLKSSKSNKLGGSRSPFQDFKRTHDEYEGGREDPMTVRNSFISTWVRTNQIT